MKYLIRDVSIVSPVEADGSVSASIVGPIDASTAAVETIDYPHHEIHAGDHYTATYVDADLDAAADIEILIVTPNTTKWGHFAFEVTGIVSTAVDFYEGTSLTAGTAITAHNNNRNSVNTAGLTITHTPSGSGDGTLLSQQIFGTPSLGQFQGATATADERNEWVLKQNESYLLRVTSDVDNNRVSIRLAWYEHTDKA